MKEQRSNTFTKHESGKNIHIIASLSINGKILYVSSNCKFILGYEQEQLINSYIKEIIHEDDIFMVESLFFHPDIIFPSIFRVKTKNNKYFWFEAEVEHIQNPSNDSSTEIFLKMHLLEDHQSTHDDLDIDHHQIEEIFLEPMEGGQKDLLIADIAPYSIIITQYGRIAYINKMAARLLGIREKETLISRSILDFIDSEFHSVVKKGILLLQKGQKIGMLEQKWKRIDGKSIEVEAKAVPLRFRGRKSEMIVLNDITSRKNFQGILQNSRERYERIVHNSIDAIAIIYNKEWVFINDSGVKMFGANSYTELLGKNIYSFLKNDDHEHVENLLRMVMAEKHEAHYTKQSWFTLTGKQFYSDLVCIPTTYFGEAAVQVIIRDISDRKNAEELMIRSEKLSIAGQLAAGIAHEIRNPLTSIKGFLQLIKMEATGNEQYYQIIFSELDRVELILSELLVLAKPTEIIFNEVDVKDILRDVVTLLDTQAILRNIQIHLNLPKEPTYITCDENQIKQVFINLIKNSIDSMTSGGNIYISILISENSIVLNFKDEGCGIPDVILDRIGEPFYTTKEKGTGLGLMVSYKIIENHKGTINVNSKVNEGTTFIITLPKPNT